MALNSFCYLELLEVQQPTESGNLNMININHNCRIIMLVNNIFLLKLQSAQLSLHMKFNIVSQLMIISGIEYSKLKNKIQGMILQKIYMEQKTHLELLILQISAGRKNLYMECLLSLFLPNRTESLEYDL